MAYRLALIPLVLLVAGSALAAQEPDREIESGGGWFILNPLHINDFQHWSSPSVNLAWTTWYTERSGWTVGAMPILGREPNRLTFFGHLTWRRRWLNNGEGNYIHLGLGAGPTIYRYRGFKAEPRHALWLWVRLFCVGGPEGSRRGCERHGKSYLTRRRRGEEGDGGGSLTGGAIPSA